MMNNKKVAFYTLGCKLNFSETSTLARTFIDNGFQRVESNEIADVYVINTCSVTEKADSKCRQAIRKLIKQAPEALIAVTGCYAQLKSDEIAEIEGVDLVIGADQKGNLFEYVNKVREKGKANVFSCGINDVNSFFQAYSSGDRTRSFLKVQDGCSYSCSYCTIPMARGKSRNMPISEIIREAQEIAKKGCKEIILTGVNIGDFGRTSKESFLDLLKALDEVEGIERYRISSIEPNLLTNEIIEFTTKSSKFLPHFHIPLQSGSNKILGLMRRRYQRELFAERVESVRKYMPDTFFGVDVIVGFPGETDEDFKDTYLFLEKLAPSFLHVFPYSERPGTFSATLNNKLNDNEITERVKVLNKLSEKLHTKFYEAYLERVFPVLFESARKNGKMLGYTDNYIKVEIPYNQSLIGKIKNVRLKSISPNGNMTGEVFDNFN